MSDQPIPAQPLLFDSVLKAEHEAIRPDEDPDKPGSPWSALCVSGGGIRSATFALGVLQGLAERRVLGEFDYLSTVSGGGYIGSWLTAWKQRLGGLDKVTPVLLSSSAAKDGPDAVQYLREYNNFLSPKLGLFSADTWTLAATVARNLLLNWLVLLPLLLFVLMAPRLIVSLARAGEYLDAVHAQHGDSWVQITRLDDLLAAFAGLMFAIATFNMLRYLPGVGRVNKSEIHFLKYCLAPLICSVLVFITLDAWITGGNEHFATTLTWKGLLLGISGSSIAGWIAYLVFYVKRTYRRRALIAGLTTVLLLTSSAAALAVWMLVSKVFPSMGWVTYVTLGPPTLLLAVALPVVVFVGLTSRILEDEDREWLSRAGAWLLLVVLGWAAVCCLVLIAPVWVFKLHALGKLISLEGIGGAITALVGFRSDNRIERENLMTNSDRSKPALGSALLGIFVQITAALFVIFLLTALAILTNWLLAIAGVAPSYWTAHWQFLENTQTRWVVAAAAVFLASAWAMAQFININKFSLHAMYRNRLIRAYLGASNDRSNADKFTGFAANDDLHMGELNAHLKPFHVVNTTLNLVAGQRLAWQQRKAEPFTITPLHCGNFSLGYRPSQMYGGRDGITLGTAMTLSGAAASPNMGYYSSPVLGFIMTLFNARLGAWLGNSGKPGDSTWQKPGPSSAIKSLVREAFGLTNESCPYIYLSDGGHFENLGIYEMVKRRCRCIVVVDGAADGELKFGDLGNAVRKIRIDTKVEIQFQERWAHSLRDREKRWAVAKILYQQAGLGEDGYLIYIKPLMCGTEPPDVVAYQAANPEFPHQSTANQFFNESQTESYRMLGLHTVREMLEGWTPIRGLQGLDEYVDARTVKKITPLATAAKAGG